MPVVVYTAPMVLLDRPEMVLNISWKGIQNLARGAVNYHLDITTITTTIPEDLSCFVENLDGIMTDNFRWLDTTVPFLSSLPPDGTDKRSIERDLRDRVRQTVGSRGSGGFMLAFEITVVFESDDQFPFAITLENQSLITGTSTDADSLRSPINQHPRLTAVPTDTDAASLCCSICLDKLFGEKSAVEWLPCAHGFHHGCINSWLQRARTCPLCKLSMD